MQVYPFSFQIFYHKRKFNISFPVLQKKIKKPLSPFSGYIHSSVSKTMAVSLSSLTATLSSLSFSSNISHKPTTLSLSRTLSRSPKFSSFTLSATSLVAPSEPEIDDLRKYVKSRLPGGFAAQTIIGTGRRKSAVARVVLQEGTGKIVINYRDAKVSSLSSLSFSFTLFICVFQFEVQVPFFVVAGMVYLIEHCILCFQFMFHQNAFSNVVLDLGFDENLNQKTEGQMEFSFQVNIIQFNISQN